MLGAVGYDARMRSARAVITGEGRLDQQSLAGKFVSEVATRARQAGVPQFDDMLEGPSAIAFVTGDPVEAAKGLRDFAKAHPLLVIKGGILDGKPLSAEEIRKLADLESREVLLARLAGAMKAPLQGAVSLFAAPLAQAARAFDALRVKVEATGEGSTAPSTEAAAAAEPSTEAAAAAEPSTEAAAAAEPTTEG